MSGSWGWLLALALGGAGSGATSIRAVDFNFDIRPLLSDRCFKCHGPDEKSRKAQLRLDTKSGAYRALDNGTFVINPGKPEASEVLRRIDSSEPDEQMPPPDSNLTLSARERELIRRWIAQGAEYKSHWAFLPITPSALPEPARSDWIRNPIDAFILAEIQKHGLHPSPPATRETLIRRVSLDLTGLPPTVEEIDDFLQDGSGTAYEKVVDRLLDSVAYGERMANDWMDVARYADTYGYQSDVDRDMSPWRDWVIRAFNENLPYDQFILWQLAGDLLPGATRDQVLATAFNRLHRQTNEGGSIEEEFRVEYAADRVHTMGTAFLGLTLECARCHDHKYDPITQKNYYELLAFFNNIDESGLYSHFTRAVPAPALLLYQEDQEIEHRRLLEQITEAESFLTGIRQSAGARYAAWSAAGGATPPIAQPIASFDLDALDGTKSANAVEAGRPLELQDSPNLVPGRHGQALQFSGDNSAVAKGVGDFGRSDPFSFSLWIKVTQPQERAVVLHHSRAWTDSGSRGYELLLDGHRLAFNLIHFWPGNALGVRARDPLPTNEWVHVAVSYDGSSRASGLQLYRDGQLEAREIVRDHLYKDILHRKAWGDSDVGNIHLTLAGRFRDSGFKGGMIDELLVYDQALTSWETALLAGRDSSQIDGAARFEHYLQRVDAPYRQALQALLDRRRAENEFVNDIREIMVMRDMPQRRPTYVLKRGSYMTPGEPVQPATPEGIAPFPEGLPRNRLGLARWMINPQNPLTARVAVNRVWKMHFGRGLVETLEDFGSQGRLPTHPALLDWLANRFMEQGWNRKELHKLMVMSATYQQDSSAGPDLAKIDPDNRWLARGPKHRLAAEVIRDSALAVSGLLSRRVGGPSVYPYQPPGLWEESGTGKTYHPSTGEDRHRRSLYTFWRRTAPPPAMLTFDATSREVCTARREITSTPLQSLVLLNDPQFVEASRALAERLMQKHPDQPDAALPEAWRLVTGRAPDGKEIELLRQLYAEQLRYFRESPEAARAYLGQGDKSPSLESQVTELASLSVVASALMNYDEFVVKR